MPRSPEGTTELGLTLTFTRGLVLYGRAVVYGRLGALDHMGFAWHLAAANRV